MSATLSPVPPFRLLPCLRGNLLLALGYLLLSLLVSLLALPPGYAVPLFPSAGLALVAVLVGGWRLLPGAALGALLFNVWLGWHNAQWQAGLWMGLVVAVGAALQAAAGVWLIRRLLSGEAPLPERLSLDAPRQVFRVLLLAGPLACLVSASLSVTALVALGLIPGGEWLTYWWGWWGGDTSGVLIMLPLLLPLYWWREAGWQGRWRTVSLPMAGCLLLVGGLHLLDTRLDQARVEREVAERAGSLARALTVRLQGYLNVLQAGERFAAHDPAFTGDAFRRFATPWFERFSGLNTLGYIEVVEAAQRAAFEARLRREGVAHGILDRDDNGNRFPAPPRDRYHVVRFSEPQPRNAAALGLNSPSLPASADALLRAERSGQAMATQRIRLVQEQGVQSGVVVYQSVLPEANAVPRAYVYLTLRLGDLVSHALSSSMQRELAVCLRDRVAPPEHTRLFGDAACQPAAFTPFSVVLPLQFAGREWELLVHPQPALLRELLHFRTPAAATAGLLAGGLLGAFLLVLSGQRRRVLALVAQRTGELDSANRELAQRNEQLTVLGNNLPDGAIFQWLRAPDGNWRLGFLSDGWRQLAGGVVAGELAADDLERMLGVLDADSRQELEAALLGAGKRERLAGGPPLELVVRTALPGCSARWLHLRAAPRQLADGQTVWDGLVLDVTERKQADERIHFLVHFDPVTLLPNRTLFVDRCTAALASAARYGDRAAVLLFDLQGFKRINDSLGHRVGDELLREMARRLNEVVGEGDTVARMGGDEFAILTSRFAEPAELAQFGSLISRALRAPFLCEGQELNVHSCAGISVFPDDARDAETLLRHADFALSEAKARGPGRRRFFAGEMNARASERLELEALLRQALEKEELVLFFQPQIELATRQLVGVEALLRWRRPEIGLVPPDRFIPLAEESELIVPIGEWVLAQACALARSWEVSGRPLRVAVNVSAVQFRRRNFVERVGHILGQSGVSPALIELEMTESAVMEDSSRTSEHLQALKAMGVRLAIDDFGTGYSSLAYLKRFPLHQLKIDRSFVRDLPGNREDAAIAGAVLALARSLDLAVVAEGVETEAQQAFLHLLGCQIGQGFYYAKPLPLPELESFRANWVGGPPPIDDYSV